MDVIAFVVTSIANIELLYSVVVYRVFPSGLITIPEFCIPVFIVSITIFVLVSIIEIVPSFATYNFVLS